MYHQLDLQEREEISRLLSMDKSLRAIARTLNRSPSTISREIRNKARSKSSYRACLAQRKALKNARSRRSGKRIITLNPDLEHVIRSKLKSFWSPAQIAQHLKTFYQPHMHVCPETIYSFIYILPRGTLRKELTKCLRQQHKKRRVQGHSKKGQTSNLEDMLSIEERPAEVADRTIPGHWEGDLIIGDARRQTALGTLVERTTRYLILVPLQNKTAAHVREAFAKELKNVPLDLRKTLTYDQGREMAQHKLFTKNTQMKVYFCNPRSPWERGTNENTNGLLRQFFPKSTNFTQVTPSEVKRVQHLMNERPRKTLEWKTPNQAFSQLLH